MIASLDSLQTFVQDQITAQYQHDSDHVMQIADSLSMFSDAIPDATDRQEFKSRLQNLSSDVSQTCAEMIKATAALQHRLRGAQGYSVAS